MKNKMINDYMYNKAYVLNKPISVMIELLTQCNLKCKHCYIPEHIDRGMTLEKIKVLLNELRDMGILNVSLTGGEIFLRNDIFDIIEYARGLNMRVFLLSNGTLIDKECAEKLASLYIAEFSTTIFSMNEEIHDYITQKKGSLKAVLDGISLLKEAGVKVKVKTPLMDINAFEYENIQNYCQENSFDYLVSPVISRKSNGDESTLDLRMSQEKLIKVLKFVDEQNAIEHLHKQDTMCAALHYSFSIDCNGNVYPCNSFFLKLGNIYEQKVNDIWIESEQRKKILQIHNKELECVKCIHKEYCNRCPAMALSDGNGLYGCDCFAKQQAEIREKNYYL